MSKQSNCVPRKSPKKRPIKRYAVVSSSSSTESLASDTRGKCLVYLKNKKFKRHSNKEE